MTESDSSFSSSRPVARKEYGGALPPCLCPSLSNVKFVVLPPDITPSCPPVRKIIIFGMEAIIGYAYYAKMSHCASSFFVLFRNELKLRRKTNKQIALRIYFHSEKRQLCFLIFCDDMTVEVEGFQAILIIKIHFIFPSGTIHNEHTISIE